MGIYRVAMGMLCGCYGVAMGMLWGCYGVALGMLWGCYGDSMEMLWGCYGVAIGQRGPGEGPGGSAGLRVGPTHARGCG